MARPRTWYELAAGSGRPSKALPADRCGSAASCVPSPRQMSAAGPGIRRGVRPGIGPGPGLGDPGQDVIVDLDWFLQMQEMAGVFDHDHE